MPENNSLHQGNNALAGEPTENNCAGRPLPASAREQAVRSIRIEDYDYPLPDERIALYPLPRRDESKLLVYRPFLEGEQALQASVFKHVTEFLPKPSLLVFNNTRVVRARLVFFKEAGDLKEADTIKAAGALHGKAGSKPEAAQSKAKGNPPARIEVFCLEPTQPADIALAFSSTGRCRFKCLIGNNKRWKNGLLRMAFPLPDGHTSSKNGIAADSTNGIGPNYPTQTDTIASPRQDEAPNEPIDGKHAHTGELRVEKIGSLEDAFEVEFSWSPEHLSFSEVLEQAGKVPLPPYIHRQAEDSDTERYQTVFARYDGSVAAPTAGLHFTPQILQSLPDLGIEREFITLHVGAGTFKPVKADHIGEHSMHREHISVKREFVQHLSAALEKDMPVIPVGTTSMRSLESLYWIGARIKMGSEKYPVLAQGEFEVDQWDPYGELAEAGFSPSDSLRAILDYLDDNHLDELHGHTALMIAPGYRFAFCKGIVTNFHQPKSTLLLLVSALIGPAWRKIYDFALENGFRFLSYGDSCLFLPLGSDANPRLESEPKRLSERESAMPDTYNAN